jgi:hypothetical protein
MSGRNQECSGTGRSLERNPVLIAMADIVKEINEICTILGYVDDWVIVTSSKAPIRAETD